MVNTQRHFKRRKISGRADRGHKMLYLIWCLSQSNQFLSRHVFDTIQSTCAPETSLSLKIHINTIRSTFEKSSCNLFTEIIQ